MRHSRDLQGCQKSTSSPMVPTSASSEMMTSSGSMSNTNGPVAEPKGMASPSVPHASEIVVSARQTWRDCSGDAVGAGGVSDGVGGSDDVVIELHQPAVDHHPRHLLNLVLQVLPVGVLQFEDSVGLGADSRGRIERVEHADALAHLVDGGPDVPVQRHAVGLVLRVTYGKPWVGQAQQPDALHGQGSRLIVPSAHR